MGACSGPGGRPLPSARGSLPSPAQPSHASEKLWEPGPRRQRGSRRAGGTKGANGPGRMLRSPAPHPGGSRALRRAQVARPSAPHKGVRNSGTQRLTSAGPGARTPLPATHSPSTFLQSADGDPSARRVPSAMLAELVQVTLGGTWVGWGRRPGRGKPSQAVAPPARRTPPCLAVALPEARLSAQPGSVPRCSPPVRASRPGSEARARGASEQLPSARSPPLGEPRPGKEGTRAEAVLGGGRGGRSPGAWRGAGLALGPEAD